MPSDATFSAFSAALGALLPSDHIVTDLPRRTALGVDASFYTLTPRLVVYIPDIEAMQALLRLATQYEIAVTFRAAGTSLSGQAISDSVLVMLTRDWTDAHVLDEGQRIRLAPGVIGAKANTLLQPWGRKIGPDPASINSCKIGGIAANNASGMCCGVAHNSYHTLSAMRLVLADGSELNTADPASVAVFRQSHAPLLSALEDLRGNIAGEPHLRDRIRHQFRLKNTMGYGLNALTDYTDPVDILTHLMIGSEGTLGFIADITYRTVAIPRVRKTGLYLFPDSAAACAVIPLLKDCQADAVELMDSRALCAVRTLLAPFFDGDIDDGNVALLIDIGDNDETALDVALQRIAGAFEALPVAARPVTMCAFTGEVSSINALWDIRKGLFPAVGAVRETGTTVIIEDVAFDLANLPDGLHALTQLFIHFGYDDAIIFGHALDGNVHFVFSQGVSEEELQRYNQFMQAVVETVAGRFAGSLKAEHGTGRNMAPFLLHQWGEDGIAVMRALKQLFDPVGILNPGVILNEDPQAHLKHIKPLPPIDGIVDTCIECGFCEPVCPSLHHTLSPRQRIALARRAVSLTPAEQQQITAASQDLSLDSCAATGMCATRCPVGINTGEWVLNLRAQQARTDSLWQADHIALTTDFQRLGLRAAGQFTRLAGKQNAANVSKALNTLTKGRVPYLIPTLPVPAPLPDATHPDPVDAIYFPTCPSRLFGLDKSEDSLTDIAMRLFRKAGLRVAILPGYRNTCCGQPFSSKGQTQAASRAQHHLKSAISTVKNGDRLPLIMDASACALSAGKNIESNTIELSEYLLREVAPRLSITPLNEPVMLHVSCASSHSDMGMALRTLTALCATSVTEAADIACCGFAGDKGLSRPDLNASALAGLSQQVPPGCQRGVSNSRTCEIGLSHHSGIHYGHIACLLDEVSASHAPVP